MSLCLALQNILIAMFTHTCTPPPPHVHTHMHPPPPPPPDTHTHRGMGKHNFCHISSQLFEYFHLSELLEQFHPKWHVKFHLYQWFNSPNKWVSIKVFWGVGIAQWLSARLMIRRWQLWVPARAAGEISPPVSTVCAFLFFSIHSTHVLVHLTDPSHSVKVQVAGYSWTCMHLTYVALYETVNWCKLVWCTQNVHQDLDGSSFTWHQHARTQTHTHSVGRGDGQGCEKQLRNSY